MQQAASIHMPGKLQLTHTMTVTNTPIITVLQLLSMTFLYGHNATKIHICNTNFKRMLTITDSSCDETHCS